MRKSDIRIGMTVYHTTMTHWGQGKVLEKTTRCARRGMMGYHDVDAWLIEWSHSPNRTRSTASDLRKTPNKRKEASFAKAIAIRDANRRKAKQ